MGEYVAAVPVALIEDDQASTAYMSREDAYRLDVAHEALPEEHLARAARYGVVYTLNPVA